MSTMDDWHQAWQTFVEETARDVEDFFQDVARDMSDAADALMEFADDVIEQVEQAIAPELNKLDEQFDDWLEPVLQAMAGIEGAIAPPLDPIYWDEPHYEDHPVCANCRHFHGHAYNGVTLVCAMHPYGVEDGVDTCPDKESR